MLFDATVRQEGAESLAHEPPVHERSHLARRPYPGFTTRAERHHRFFKVCGCTPTKSVGRDLNPRSSPTLIPTKGEDGTRDVTYTDASLRKAITPGIDRQGGHLEWPMPQWQLTDQEWTGLLAYLKRLNWRWLPKTGNHEDADRDRRGWLVARSSSLCSPSRIRSSPNPKSAPSS